MKSAQEVVNSKQFKAGAEIVESVVGGAIGEIPDKLEEEKLRKLEELKK